VLVHGVERQRPGGKAPFACDAVAYDMDGVEAATTIEGARDLRHHGRRCAEPDRGHLGPPALDQRIDVSNGRIDKGDFFDVGHGITSKCACQPKPAGPGIPAYLVSVPGRCEYFIIELGPVDIYVRARTDAARWIMAVKLSSVLS
jgi:hypothetical protein